MFLNRFTIKRVLMLICYQTLEPPGGALCGSVDGPRPRYRSRSPLLVPDGLRVRMGFSSSRKNPRICPREGPCRRGEFQGCSGIGRPPRTSLGVVESHRGEVISRGRLILALS
jgi:hypothetical protein